MDIGVSSVGFMKELWWALLFRLSISFSEDQESDETQLFLTPHYDLLSVTAQDNCFSVMGTCLNSLHIPK